MTHEEAAADARRRNLELGAKRITDRCWIETETEPGRWTVELHVDEPDRRPLWKRLLEGFFNNPWG